MSLPYDHASIWLKAKSYINRSFSALDDGDEDLAKLWAAISLELLAKSALCKVSPLLVADPSDDGRSLLIAAGLPEDTTRYKSVPAKALFSRCARAFRTFDKDRAGVISAQRNAELHSGASPFAEIVDHGKWWEQFWSNAEVLVVRQDRELVELVSPTRVDNVQGHLDRNADNVRLRVDSLMDAARQHRRLGTTPDPPRPPESDLSANLACPICEEMGALFGEEITQSIEIDWGDGEDWPTEIVEVWTDAFACETCGLLVEGESYISAAELPESFEAERIYDPDPGDLYGND